MSLSKDDIEKKLNAIQLDLARISCMHTFGRTKPRRGSSLTKVPIKELILDINAEVLAIAKKPAYRSQNRSSPKPKRPRFRRSLLSCGAM